MSALVSRYGGFPLPAKVKSAAKKAMAVGKTMGEFGMAMATEPFTNKIIKKTMNLTDEQLKRDEARAQEKKTSLIERYPSSSLKRTRDEKRAFINLKNEGENYKIRQAIDPHAHSNKP